MNSMNEDRQTFLQLISQYWFLILFVGGMLVTWGTFSNKIAVLEQRVATIETSQQKINDTISEMQGDIREIKTSVLFIKDAVQK